VSWISRFVNVFRPSGVDRALDEEITFHIDSRVDDLVAAGMSRAEAETTAARQFGNRLYARESSRDVQLVSWLDDLVRDVRHGVRALGRTPIVAVVTIVTLALGIGAHTAIFSMVSGVLLRPLAYPRPAELMYFTTTGARSPFPVSVAEYLEFQRFSQSYASVGAFRTGEVNVTADDRARRVRSAFVDAPLLNALGLETIMGRLFTTADSPLTRLAGPGAVALTAPVVMISYELWQSALGARPIAGQRLDVDGRRLEIVGVLARGADLMDRHTDIWLPLGFTEAEVTARNNHNLMVIGRLKDGITRESAQSELNALTESWVARTGLTPGGDHAGHVFSPPAPGRGGHMLEMTPLTDRILGRAAQSIWVLQAAVGLVLLIACANVGNLLLVRAQMRRREFAMLSALGASRGRLLRKTLTESVMLSLAGGALGVLLARAGVAALVAAYPSSLPRIGDVTVDPGVTFMSFAVAVACGLVFGLAPMRHAGSDVTADALKSVLGGSSGTAGHRLRRALVVTETALAVIVVVGAGLLLRTVDNLRKVDAGFDRSRLVTFSITLPRASFDLMARLRTYQNLLDRLRAVPGVEDASAMTSLPLDRPFLVNQTEITNNETTVPTIGIDYQRVMSGFFETMGVAVVQGRGFLASDAAQREGVTVVNETLANTYWKGRDPIGQRLRPGGTMPWLTVIGVAKDVKQTGVDQSVGAEAYVLVDQITTNTATSFLSISPTTVHVVIRTSLPLATLAPTIEQVVRNVDRAVPVARLREMDDVFGEAIQRPRLLAQLLTLFSVLAVMLAVIGTYGVLASLVADRRREIGIRLALGANRGHLLATVMAEGLSVALVGVALGVAGALVLGRFLTSLLFGVDPTDVTTLAIVILSVVAMAALASWLPAWRASRVDPGVVLRAE
jgi:predicted permease